MFFPKIPGKVSFLEKSFLRQDDWCVQVLPIQVQHTSLYSPCPFTMWSYILPSLTHSTLSPLYTSTIACSGKKAECGGEVRECTLPKSPLLLCHPTLTSALHANKAWWKSFHLRNTFIFLVKTIQLSQRKHCTAAGTARRQIRLYLWIHLRFGGWSEISCHRLW